MTVGTGADTLQNIPAQAYVVDPGQFFQLTSRNVAQFFAQAGAAGTPIRKAIPQVGIVSKLRIKFVGTMAIDNTADAVTGMNWPYGLLDDYKLSANGQNDLFSCNGVDLAVLRDLRYPAYSDVTDVFPGTVGGGNTVAKNASYALSLTWEVPIAMDDVSLVGALFAQSSSTNLVNSLRQATVAQVITTAFATTTITGTWFLEETYFEVPFDDKGQLVVPDLSRLHGFNAVDIPVNNVGENKGFLVRSQGQLCRLISSVQKSTTARLSALDSTAAASKLDTWRFEYGGNQRPYVFDPASQLLSLNNQWYGGTCLYDRVCLDLVKENPARDVILMAGITEPAVVVGVNSAVTLASATQRIAQETMF